MVSVLYRELSPADDSRGRAIESFLNNNTLNIVNDGSQTRITHNSETSTDLYRGCNRGIALIKTNHIPVHGKSGEGHFGAAVSAPPTRRRRFGAAQLGPVPFRRRTFRRRFLIFFYFSNYEEKTMKQAIS